MSIRYDSPSTVAPPVSNYSHVAVADLGSAKLLHLAGQVALDKAGTLIGAGDITQQTEQIFANIGAILAAHNATMHHVVKMTYYYTDMHHRSAVAAVRDRYLPQPGPPSTAVAVSSLALPEWLLEIDVVAVVTG